MSEPAGKLPLPYVADARTATPPLPLVVDLDGTLIASDLLIESVIRLLRDKPLALLALPRWLVQGRAHLKREVAQRVDLDATLLPYRTELVEYLRAERARGRKVILATASDERLARQIAAQVGCFDEVLASDGVTNLSGAHKRARLVAELGERGFDYIGNESRDLPVWSSARKALVISSRARLLRRVARVADCESAFSDRPASLREYVGALRPEHWLKNVLVFVPVCAAHLFFAPEALMRTLMAFAAFCCCASGGYLVNDLLDLQADRRHPQKRLRPFASGRISLVYPLLMAPALMMLGALLGAMLSPLVLAMLLVYLGLTLAYSLRLKHVALLDILVLATLYTLRIVAGSAAIALWPSVWLVGFALFLFTSLAFVKRYAELVIMRDIEGQRATARGYELSDAELLASKGTASGYAAVLVLAIYIASGAANVLYSRHQLIWLVCPLLLYWLGYLWLVAHRGRMYHDPLVFALRDRTSRILVLLMVATVLLAI
ncbi:MAG TPA: UbiA family prenyltransferase [Steroidobacteraceae bacterium]|nr:UbiA family prenyltransferase [Steroidobacteraceae bacterium]